MKVRFLEPAKRELTEAVLFYNSRRRGLGAEFRTADQDATLRIKNFPLAWHPLEVGKDGDFFRCHSDLLEASILADRAATKELRPP